MDRYLRILQRQVNQEVNLDVLPHSLQLYIANLERLAGMGSIFDLEIADREGELELRGALVEVGGQAVGGKIATGLINVLNRLGAQPTLEGLSSVNPSDLAVMRGIGRRSMAVIAETLANSGLLNPEWLAFVIRNRLFFEGQERPQL